MKTGRIVEVFDDRCPAGYVKAYADRLNKHRGIDVASFGQDGAIPPGLRRFKGDD